MDAHIVVVGVVDVVPSVDVSPTGSTRLVTFVTTVPMSWAGSSVVSVVVSTSWRGSPLSCRSFPVAVGDEKRWNKIRNKDSRRQGRRKEKWYSRSVLWRSVEVVLVTSSTR